MRDYHTASWNNWKEQNKKRIKGISKINSELVLRFLSDMEIGQNIWKRSKKGGRSHHRLNVLKNKLLQMIKILEKRGIKDLREIKENDLHILANDLFKGNIKRVDGQVYKHPTDFIRNFKTFWHWWMKVNKKEGKLLPDICEDLDTSMPENQFVYLSKEQVDQLAKDNDFTSDQCMLIQFLFDSILRFPSEALNLKVKNIYMNKDNVCVSVTPDVGTKTKASIRNFNLLYCGNKILKYIELNRLENDDNLFKFMKDQNYVYKFNKKLKKVAVKLFGDVVSHPIAGKKYSELSGYDIRHSGTIHFRLLASKNGNISLDAIRQRGGWSDFDMLNYYTKFLGLDGEIDRELTLTTEDKTKLEQELEKLKEQFKAFIEGKLVADEGEIYTLSELKKKYEEKQK